MPTSSINIYYLIYTIIYLLSFCLSYYVIISSRLESLFKQGSIWPIRIAQILLSGVIAYLFTQGIYNLIVNFNI